MPKAKKKKKEESRFTTTHLEEVLANSEAFDGGIPKKAAKKIVQDLIDGITDAVARGDIVSFRQLGTIRTVHRKACKRRNPQTGEKVDVPAKDVIKFKASSAFKAKVNEAS